MRKMYSKNQIAVIAKNVVDNNEVIKNISYDPEDDSLNIDVLLYLNGEAHFTDVAQFENEIQVDVPDNIHFINEYEEATLQDKLDEKQDIVSFESEDTFGNDLTNHKLYDSDKTGLTTEEVNTLKENMLYWIKKGYFSYGTTKYRITIFDYNSSNISMSFYEVTAQENQGDIEITGYTALSCGLNINASSYSYKHEEL